MLGSQVALGGGGAFRHSLVRYGADGAMKRTSLAHASRTNSDLVSDYSVWSSPERRLSPGSASSRQSSVNPPRWLTALLPLAPAFRWPRTTAFFGRPYSPPSAPARSNNCSVSVRMSPKTSCPAACPCGLTFPSATPGSATGCVGSRNPEGPNSTRTNASVSGSSRGLVSTNIWT